MGDYAMPIKKILNRIREATVFDIVFLICLALAIDNGAVMVNQFNWTSMCIEVTITALAVIFGYLAHLAAKSTVSADESEI